MPIFSPLPRRLVALACALGVATSFPLRAETPLRSNQAVLDLSAAEAEHRHPVEVEGVLLMVDPDRTCILHDGTTAIFACDQPVDAPDLRPGDRVRVTGVSKPGLFASVLEIHTLTRLGTGAIPPPIRTRLSGLMSPHLNPQWVEVEGIVRAAAERPGHANDSVIDLVADDVRVPVVLSGVLPAAAQQWIDARVRIRAFCLHDTNRKRQLLGARLLVPRGEPPEVLTPAPADPYSLAIQAPSDLLSYSASQRSENRVRLQGVVTQAVPPGTFYLQAGEDGIEVRSARSPIPAAGTRIDVVGFVARGKNGPALEDADFRDLGFVGKPTARSITPEQASEADCTLVEMTAVLDNAVVEAETLSLMLSAGDHRFVARLPRGEARSVPWPLHSRLRLTGICRAEPEPLLQNEFAWLSGPFHLLVRSADDVALLEAPPWWTRPEAGRIASLALLAAAIASLLLFVRYRAKAKAVELTRMAAEREFNAVLKERGRVAREIHDTLAQGLTSISAQLELARQNTETAAPSALRHIDLARDFVRQSLAEARRSVLALRPQLLENMQLAAALEKIAHELTLGTRIQVRIRAAGELENLPPYVEDELLRIGQEALTNAVRHGEPRTIELRLEVEGDNVRLRIVDDGIGFQPERTRRSSRKGFGLSGIEERVRLLNGRFQLTSQPGAGTQLEVEISMA